MAAERVAPQDRRDRHLLGRVHSSELSDAIGRVSIPFIVFDHRGTITMANQPVADVAGMALERIVGMPAAEFASPADAITRSISQLMSGDYKAYQAKRSVTTPDGAVVEVVGTVRAIEVDGQIEGVSTFVPLDEMHRVGRHPIRRWLDVVPVVLGRVDAHWEIHCISAEIIELIGYKAADLVGRNLLGLIDTEDADEIRQAHAHGPDVPISFPCVRFRMADGANTEVCMLIGPRSLSADVSNFAMAGVIENFYSADLSRVEELELRLRRIGAEVVAAGMMESLDSFPLSGARPELNELTSRQWEILRRLLLGERVPTIAKALYISQSTVRNHLATIFQKFGVHTQAELLELLRTPEPAR